MPLDISVLVVKRTTPDFKQTHRHPRSYFREFHAIVARSYVDVMPNLNVVVIVFERDDAVANLALVGDGVHRREQMLQGLANPLAESGSKRVED